VTEEQVSSAATDPAAAEPAVEPVVEPAVEPVVAETVVEPVAETVVEPVVEPTAAPVQPPLPADEGVPDEAGVDPDAPADVVAEEQIETEEPVDAVSSVVEEDVQTDDQSILAEDWEEAPLDISDRINLDSAAVDDLSARQFLEVEDLLKDPSNLSDPAALEGLDPSQMQLLIGALAGQVNDPLGLSEGGGFEVQDLLDPDAPGPTLDPELIDNLDADQMGQVQEVLGGEGPPDLAALEELSPEQVQAVVQSFLGFLGTPGANVIDDPDGGGAVASTAEDEPQDLEGAFAELEDAIAGGDREEIDEALEDIREMMSEGTGEQPGDLDPVEDALADVSADIGGAPVAVDPAAVGAQVAFIGSAPADAPPEEEDDSFSVGDIDIIPGLVDLGDIGDAVVDVGEAIDDANDAVVDFFTEGGIGEVAVDVGEAVADAAEEVGEVAVDVGEAIGDAAEEVGEFFEDLF
jgi:hypothetical protein